jgi:hypothetical protein
VSDTVKLAPRSASPSDIETEFSARLANDANCSHLTDSSAASIGFSQFSTAGPIEIFDLSVLLMKKLRITWKCCKFLEEKMCVL